MLRPDCTVFSVTPSRPSSASGELRPAVARVGLIAALVALALGSFAPDARSAASATPASTSPATPTVVSQPATVAPTTPGDPTSSVSQTSAPTPTSAPASMPDASEPGAAPPSADQPSYRSTSAVSYAARLVVPVAVRSLPSNRGRKLVALRPYGSWNGGPVVLQIADSKVVKETTWLRVRLPIRPNGATGWIKAASVEIERLRYRILISRRAHRLTLLRDGSEIASTRVVVGAPGTPTPRGSFAVLEQVRQPSGSEIGPWALHLTAHSDVLENYGGGPGRVALHGRSGPLLNDPLGSSRSHGCIRMPNAFIAKLARVATEGTPVVIS